MSLLKMNNMFKSGRGKSGAKIGTGGLESTADMNDEENLMVPDDCGFYYSRDPRSRISTGATKGNNVYAVGSGDRLGNPLDNSDRNPGIGGLDNDSVELEKIFQEKLFVGKNGNKNNGEGAVGKDTALNDIIPRDAAKKIVLPRDVPLNQISDGTINSSAIDKPYQRSRAINSNFGVLKEKTNEILSKPSLKGIYQGDDMEDEEISETREMILASRGLLAGDEKMNEMGGMTDNVYASTMVGNIKSENEGVEDIACANGNFINIGNDVVSTDANAVNTENISDNTRNSRNGENNLTSGAESNRSIRQIEEEFVRLKNTQIETLKLKSKIYKFIYAEILKIDQKYSEKVKKLEMENQELRRTVDDVKTKHERYKSQINDKMTKSMNNFRLKVVAAMKEYKRRCENKKQ